MGTKEAFVWSTLVKDINKYNYIVLYLDLLFLNNCAVLNHSFQNLPLVGFFTPYIHFSMSYIEWIVLLADFYYMTTEIGPIPLLELQHVI